MLTLTASGLPGLAPYARILVSNSESGKSSLKTYSIPWSCWLSMKIERIVELYGNIRDAAASQRLPRLDKETCFASTYRHATCRRDAPHLRSCLFHPGQLGHRAASRVLSFERHR